MSAAEGSEDRLQELVIQRALEGVTLDEARELTLLSDAYPDFDVDTLEATIAALDAIPFGEPPPLPESIATHVKSRLSEVTAPAPQVTNLPGKASPLPWFALAASLVLAGLGWYRALAPEPVAAPVVPVAQLPDAGRWDFEPTDDPAAQGIAGEVRWSTRGQRGEMLLSGLPGNDPTREQYQLWIFDATRSDAHPVDGGVFDVKANASQVVPIRPTLNVREPTLFAITIEPPGGVMVSSRERLVALARVP